MSEEEIFYEDNDIITDLSENENENLWNESNQFSFHDIDSEIIESETVTSESSIGSSVWKYFDKSPPNAPGYNVCKECFNKYKLTTSVTSLRKHLTKHHLKAPTKKQKILPFKRVDPFNEHEQNEHDMYLIRWVICDLQPFTVVDNFYFRKFINFLCSRYTIPDRHRAKGKHKPNSAYVKSYNLYLNFLLILKFFNLIELIINEFVNQRAKITGEFYQIPGKYSLTADIWTSSINREAFLGLTVHYIDSNWCLHNFLLDIIPFKISHSGMNIAKEIMRVLEEFNITEKIIALTTDNASAMLVCGKEIVSILDNEFSSLIFSHYHCAAHILNLAVQQGLKSSDNIINKIRNLMGKLKNSTRLCDDLRLLCEIKKINYLKPILDVETRWNSTYYMLKRFEILQPALILLAVDHQSLNISFNNNEWIVIKVKKF